MADASAGKSPRHRILASDDLWVIGPEIPRPLASTSVRSGAIPTPQHLHETGDTDAGLDRFAGLRQIGIDEISYKRGPKYLTVVVDHDTGRLVWAAPCRDRATLRTFFDELGPERCSHISHISADGADWIAAVAAERCPGT